MANFSFTNYKPIILNKDNFDIWIDQYNDLLTANELGYMIDGLEDGDKKQLDDIKITEKRKIAKENAVARNLLRWTVPENLFFLIKNNLTIPEILKKFEKIYSVKTDSTNLKEELEQICVIDGDLMSYLEKIQTLRNIARSIEESELNDQMIIIEVQKSLPIEMEQIKKEYELKKSSNEDIDFDEYITSLLSYHSKNVVFRKKNKEMISGNDARQFNEKRCYKCKSNKHQIKDCPEFSKPRRRQDNRY